MDEHEHVARVSAGRPSDRTLDGSMDETAATTAPSPGSDLDPDLPVGSIVGEYRVEGKLGQGGFGAVFKAVHPLIGKVVAIKVLSTRFSADREMVSRFIAEAKAVNQIRHHNIIDIFSFGQLEDRRCYYVMEYVDGQPLDKFLEAGPLSVARALPIVRAIARALDAAHAKGIAHRDLKAENVFLGTDTDGAVFPKLLDFGIAKLMSGEDGIAHKTRTGAPMGTPYYMSPEQTRGRDVDHRTDLYAFGVLIYLMLTGKYPLDGDDFMTILMRQVSDDPLPPSTHQPGLPERVDHVVAWLMHKRPDCRPPNLMTAVRALEEVAGSAPTTAELTAPVVIPSSITTRPPAVAPVTVPLTVPLAAPLAASPRSNLPLVIGGLVAIALAIVVVVVATRRDPTPVVEPGRVDAALAQPDTASPDTAQPLDAAAAMPPDTAQAMVTITLKGAPDGIEVRAGGQLVGTTPKLQLPRGSAEVLLVLAPDGYVPATVAVTPTTDLEKVIKLKARGGRPPVQGSAGSGSSEPTDEIIDFPNKKSPTQ